MGTIRKLSTYLKNLKRKNISVTSERRMKKKVKWKHVTKDYVMNRRMCLGINYSLRGGTAKVALLMGC